VCLEDRAMEQWVCAELIFASEEIIARFLAKFLPELLPKPSDPTIRGKAFAQTESIRYWIAQIDSEHTPMVIEGHEYTSGSRGP